MGRPRKIGQRRKPGGRLYPKKKEERDRHEVLLARQRRFKFPDKFLNNPLSGYLCGLLYLYGKIDARHLGHFFSFLQIIPRDPLQSIPLVPKIQSGNQRAGIMRPEKLERKLKLRPEDSRALLSNTPHLGSTRYFRLLNVLGDKVVVLYELMHDRLVVPVNQLKTVLEQVPLTSAGDQFSSWCETQHPRNRR